MKLKISFSCLILSFCVSGLNADWPMFRKDAMHTGFSTETGVLDSVRLRWDWDLPSMIGCMRQSSPVIGDLDGDDTCEIVVSASTAGYVYVLKDSVERVTGTPDTFKYHGRLVWSYKVSGWTNSSPLLFDINGDNKLEVIFGSHNDSLYALTYSGGLIWKFATTGLINSSPVAGDIDKNGMFEIAIGSDDSCVYVVNWMGLEDWHYKTNGAVVSSPAIGDINGDDTCEVVVGSKDHKLYVFDCRGDTVWTFTAGHEIWSSPALGDLDGDSILDIVFGCWDSYVYALKGNDGSLLWTYKTASYIDYQSAGIADVDNDSLPEVVIASFAGGSINVINGENGGLQWAQSYFGYPVPSSPAIADIDRDDSLEAILSIHDGYCYAFRGYDGSEQWTFGYSNGDQDCPPAIGDIDCDSSVEIVGSDIAKRKIFVLDFPIPLLAGVEESSLIEPDYNLAILQNPCRNNTTIQYHLPFTVDRLQLTIYDLSGRSVKTLVNEHKTAGNYTLNLNAQDLSSGIYFITLSAGYDKTSKKLILMK